MTLSKIGLVSGAAAALFALTGCGTSGSNEQGSAPAPSTSTSAQPSSATSPSEEASATTGQTVSITIEDFKYQTPATVAPGATVTVTNNDSASHTVTSDDGEAFDVTVPGNGSATFTAPSKPGAYAFHCTFHGNMQGTLVVKT